MGRHHGLPLVEKAPGGGTTNQHSPTCPTCPPAYAIIPCRGAHTFFLRQGEVQRWGGYTVNLIHYEDAARLCLAVLQGAGSPDGAPYRGRTFLGCDGSPVTFEVGHWGQ